MSEDDNDQVPGDDPLSNVTPLRPDAPGQAGQPESDTPEPPDPPEAPDEEMRARLEAAAKLPLNDYGNGRRFALHFGADSMKVPRVGWFIWAGTHWAKDPDELAVRRNAHRLSELILREIPVLSLEDWQKSMLDGKDDLHSRWAKLEKIRPAERSEEQAAELRDLRQKLDAIHQVEKSLAERRKSHRNFARSSGNTEKMKNALREAEPFLARDFDDLDADPLAVNCESGVLRFRLVDMGEDGGGRVAEVALEPHCRDQLITKMMPVRYDPDATRDRFDAFLERVQPDREVREFLKRWMGLSMLGVQEQRLAFFHGGGANGKSVIVDLVSMLLGNYAATARIESLTGTNRRGGADATPDLIPMMGARMLRTSEPDMDQRLQEGLVKELTGGEPILVRAFQQDFVEVRPIFKLIISGNHKPNIRGTDDGIWRRVLLVPFDVHIPEAERIGELAKKLFAAEASGVLNWLVEGALDYLERGLDPPEAVVEATREYREESDPIGVFLTSCCVVTGEASDTITSKELGDAFAFHLLERGMSPWRPATFARQIAAKSRHWRHPETGRQFAKSKASISQYVGLQLTDAFRRRFEMAPKDHQGRPLTGGSDSPDPDMGF